MEKSNRPSMMQILRFQLPCLPRRSALLVAKHSSLQLELRLPPSRRAPSQSPPWSPARAAIQLGHRRAASTKPTQAWRRARLSALPRPSSSSSRELGNSERSAMLRKLSICTGWKSAKRSHTTIRTSPQLRKDGPGAQRSEDESAPNSVEKSEVDDEGRVCAAVASTSEKQWDDVIPSEDATFLASIMTRYNFIRVLEVAKTSDHPMAGARVLLLDKFGNVHSLYHEYRLLTDSYYDVFPTLPAIIPDGPIGIFGLAAGTAARLIHYFWPDRDIYGWELDPAVVYVARKYFSLEELECSHDFHRPGPMELGPMEEGGFVGPASYRKWKRDHGSSVFAQNGGGRRADGRLRVVIGDALSADAAVHGGFAGLIVDLFAEGAVVPALQEPGVWRAMKEKLRPGGRIMINCGGSCVDAGVGKKDGRITMEETVAAIAREFPGQLSVLPLRRRGDNYIALTGPPPDLEAWCHCLPECLQVGCADWLPVSDTGTIASASQAVD
ncbi:hypothetical protein MPTK1_1g09100 [Marchantia polymorpha subsp. ruderalis]|uniref:PABS domain-containing protein n=4 Tax=Marchantia polymorpha TaxID=3197 RepID=A0AAF6AN58_MARPO|nr:hypothetical protein MARPO_0036s0150 [Marchantia polymorpha]BBM97878.1 hypothetical protein Mp_1g09100 [Marchantia polymorpha subsp. ruderalis]|eukprot:PTQ41180.1 hypothetical protein MARPO_0036s0150 [Marchantia polymorpha]